MIGALRGGQAKGGHAISDKIERLENLVHLAKEPTSEGRRKLLREVTDLFLESPESLKKTEIAQFGDIMGQIAHDLEMSVRQHLAEQLAAVDAAPLGLVTKLANDEIEVARPILQESGVLRDEDLLEIVKIRSQEYLMAVSVRETVSERVSDGLVARGSDAVLESLAGNKGAQFSRAAMETMMSRAEDNEALQEPLVMRADVPPDLMKKIYNHVSSALRDHILNSGLDVSQVDGLMAETLDWFEAGEKEYIPSPAEKFIIRKEKLNQLNKELLLLLAQQGKIPEFIAGVARLGKLDVATASRAILDQGGEKLAVVCKAIDFDAAAFSNLLILTDPDDKRPREEREALIGVYGRITMEAAQRAMRFLRTRQSMADGGGGTVLR